MPAIYDLIDDYDSLDPLISMAPVWVLAVARWTHPFLFDRQTLASSSLDFVEQLPDFVIIVSDCTSIDITSNKRSHVSGLNATLRDNNINYLSSIFPDDWLVAFMVPNETRAKTLVKKLRAGIPCNGFYEGLKFLGRVDSIFKDIAVDDAGKPTSIFNMNGVGFGEFDYTLFWEPLLVNQESLPAWYQRLGNALNKVITGNDNSVNSSGDPNSIDVNKMIPFLVRLILGEGPFKNNNLSLPGGANASPNGGIRVPSLIGKLLGKSNTESLNYSNVVDVMMGVQKYKDNQYHNDPKMFVPDGITTSVSGGFVDTITDFSSPPPTNFVEAGDFNNTVVEYQKTPIGLLGEFPIVQLPFQDTPVWSILENFLNPSINEMYVALKPDQDGNIFPRLTVRQIPFNTIRFDEANTAQNGPAVTTFLELPRWRIDSKMLKKIRVGRSNALRFNFFHIQGTGPGTAINKNLQYVQSGGPRSDKNDIERSGLRPCVRTVNCLIKDATQGPALWRDIITDISAGQHLTLTGVIVTVGIIPPIAPGDNVQFANVVYHVESVQQSGTMSADGKRSWFTTLQVTNGMADEDTLFTNQKDINLDSPLEEYAGVRNSDPASVKVGRTVLDSFESSLLDQLDSSALDTIRTV